MSVARFRPNVTVACIVRYQDKFLLVEEIIDGVKKLNQPAGHLEWGESLPDAAKRELKEEAGIQAEPTGLCGIYLNPTSDKPLTYLRFGFVFELTHLPNCTSTEENIIAWHWLTAEQIIERAGQLRSPAAIQCVQDTLQSKLLPLNILRFTPIATED